MKHVLISFGVFVGYFVLKYLWIVLQIKKNKNER